MAEKEYLSGEELYKYLHISKRKMKYLIEHGYIPAVDTGKRTYRYQVTRKDAKQFKLRLEEDPNCLAPLKGKFSNNNKQAERFIIEPTKENSLKLKRFLINRWQSIPEALSADDISDLIGYSRTHINEMLLMPNLMVVEVVGKRYCTKQSLIEFLSSIEMLASIRQSEKYKTILKQFSDKKA